MSANLSQISMRRSQLLAQSEAQRAILSLHYHRFDRPARTIDATLAIAGLLKSPLVLAGITAILLKTRWRRAVRIPKLLWKCWPLLAALNQFRKSK